VLGVDPGSLKTGWAILAGSASEPRLLCCGVIRLPAESTLAERLKRLQLELQELVAEHRPAIAAVETPFHGKSSRSALQLAHARGAILACLALGNLEVAEYTPATIKKAVTGSGRADKQQVRRMIARLVDPGAARLPSDATDAVAVALCHSASAGFTAAVARSIAEAPGP
jgi:crossover junction endodeoxyribonuclease RuvC